MVGSRKDEESETTSTISLKNSIKLIEDIESNRNTINNNFIQTPTSHNQSNLYFNKSILNDSERIQQNNKLVIEQTKLIPNQ